MRFPWKLNFTIVKRLSVVRSRDGATGDLLGCCCRELRVEKELGVA